MKIRSIKTCDRSEFLELLKTTIS